MSKYILTMESAFYGKEMTFAKKKASIEHAERLYANKPGNIQVLERKYRFPKYKNEVIWKDGQEVNNLINKH
jgi:hypothetical protein